ncbi:hypothetical protein ALC60_00576, partial [Trachymyrmex zeteki]
SVCPLSSLIVPFLPHTTSAKQQIPRPSNYPGVGSFGQPFLDLNVRVPTSFTAPRTTTITAAATVGRCLEIDGPVALRGTRSRELAGGGSNGTEAPPVNNDKRPVVEIASRHEDHCI